MGGLWSGKRIAFSPSVTSPRNRGRGLRGAKEKRMRFVRIGLWTLVAAAVLPATTALAATQEREGFWIGFGAGYGSANAKCDHCVATGREGGLAGFLKLGGTLNRKVLLGAEFN